MNKTLLKQSLKDAPIIKKGVYSYVIHPLTDGIPEIQPALLKEVTNELMKQLQRIQPFDRIVTMEAMGIPLASLLSIQMNIPFTIIRKRSYWLKDEQSVTQITGYSKSQLFINGLKKDKSIVIVDDVLSTGGTLRAVLHTLQKMHVNVKAVYVAVDKGTNAKKIRNETGIPIHALATITVKDNKIIFMDE